MGDLPRVALAVAASEAEFKGLARDKWHSCRAMRHPAMPSWKRLGARHGRWSGSKKRMTGFKGISLFGMELMYIGL